ncbi:MAG: hypothetical protein LUH22_03760 [Bacteroides sp.]|nr:hypothetical protein [Bacteroides sp.]
MKRKNRHNARKAWMLLAAFLFVFLVKDFHSHRNTTACQHHCTEHQLPDSSDNKEGASCPICHFFFSPFLITENVVSFCVQSVFILDCVTIPEKGYQTFPFSFQLRAPPTLLL